MMFLNECAYFIVEIQELDSNMQYLVYENHSKFIKASETIKEVSCQSVLQYHVVDNI